MNKPKVLLCNDDGINAPGIRSLYEAASPLFDCVIVAPAENQSCKGAGASIPESRYIEAEKVLWEDNIEAWKVYGTPVDCTKFALHFLLKEKPHFILSGINDGSNAGRNVMYSGTVGAVIQATFLGVPGIAFSAPYEEGVEKFEKAKVYIPKILEHFTLYPIPKGTLMNVNFPSHSTDGIQGIKMARQGQSYWDARIGSDLALKGTRKYPILDSWSHQEEHPESDISLLKEGFITCTPVHVEDLTDYEHHKKHKPIFEELNKAFNFTPSAGGMAEETH